MPPTHAARALPLLIALLAAPASAQSVTVRLAHDDADGVIEVGDSVTWSLWIGFEGFPSGSVASGMNAAIVASDPGIVQSFEMSFNDEEHLLQGVGANGGYSGGESDGAGGVSLVNFTNSLFAASTGHLPVDQSNPFWIGSFTTTAIARGTLDYTIVDGNSSGSFASIDTSAFATTNLTRDQVAFDIDTLTIVPSPGSMAIVAVALPLLLGWRRRPAASATARPARAHRDPRPA